MSSQYEKFQCPKCGSKDLHVWVEVEANVIQSPKDFAKTVLLKDSSHTWNNASSMQCEVCDHYAGVFQFRVEPNTKESN